MGVNQTSYVVSLSVLLLAVGYKVSVCLLCFLQLEKAQQPRTLAEKRHLVLEYRPTTPSCMAVNRLLSQYIQAWDKFSLEPQKQRAYFRWHSEFKDWMMLLAQEDIQTITHLHRVQIKSKVSNQIEISLEVECV